MSTTPMTLPTITTPDALPPGPRGLFIDGSWRESVSGESLQVIAPATEEVIAEVAAGTADDIDRAVAAARRQVDGGEWSRMSGGERRRLMLRLAEAIEGDAEALAITESMDVGKPINDPRSVEIPATIDEWCYFAGWADKIDGRQVRMPPHMGRDRHTYTVREPIGVIGAIVPWNGPLMTSTAKLAPALAAGNAVVLKPAEDAPLSMLRLAALIEAVGFPPGVVNVVPGFGSVAGWALATHPGIDKVSFTGSPEVGREIAVAAAGAFRRVSLELGGKSPQIILADADLDAAIAGTALGLFANQGELCAAGTRVLVHRSLYDEVLDGLAAAAAAVRLGDPLAPGTTMGALINASQLARVTGYVEVGKEEGARVVAGGGRPERPGYFVEPTIFADGNNDMRIAREEIFGPVGLVMAFDEVDEAVRIANDTHYGLAAFVWTRDLSLAHQLAGRLQAGTVWVNGFGPPDPRVPWGGFKTSGMGRELSFTGIEESTEEKVVTIVL